MKDHTIKTIIWKIYFFVFTGILVSICLSLPSQEKFGFVDALAIAMSLIGTVGFYGYIFSVRIAKRVFWLLFFVIYMCVEASYFFFSSIEFARPELKDGESEHILLLTIVVSYGLAIPHYMGLLLYGLPSSEIWRNNV